MSFNIGMNQKQLSLQISANQKNDARSEQRTFRASNRLQV